MICTATMQIREIELCLFFLCIMTPGCGHQLVKIIACKTHQLHNLQIKPCSHTNTLTYAVRNVYSLKICMVWTAGRVLHVRAAIPRCVAAISVWRRLSTLVQCTQDTSNISADMPKRKKPSYYAVREGRIPGIYTTWEDCSNQVKGFSGTLCGGEGRVV